MTATTPHGEGLVGTPQVGLGEATGSLRVEVLELLCFAHVQFHAA